MGLSKQDLKLFSFKEALHNLLTLSSFQSMGPSLLGSVAVIIKYLLCFLPEHIHLSKIVLLKKLFKVSVHQKYTWWCA